MSAHGSSADSGGEGTDAQSATKRAVSQIRKRGRNGTLATLAGVAMLGQALRSVRKSKGRAALQTLTGAALIGVGRRQRRARRERRIETEEDVRRDEGGEKAVSDEAHAEQQNLGAGRNADEATSVYQSDTDANPRGTSERADLDSDEGDVNFVEDPEPATHREPHLEDEEAHDPRLHPDSDDEPTEVDVSESAMADEVSEAAGPSSEQASPSREGTDPEPTDSKAPDRTGEGAVAPADAEESASADRESGSEGDDGPTGESETADDEAAADGETDEQT